MILGMSVETFVQVHVAISLIAIATGIVVALAMVADKPLPGLTAVFLVSTVLTTLTGFLFPITAFTPALGVGIISSVILAVALAALYVFRLAGHWRWIYVVTAMGALYLNVFVLVVQSFQKLEALQPLAPTQSEPPFLAAQAAVLVLFIVLGILATIRYRPVPALAS